MIRRASVVVIIAAFLGACVMGSLTMPPKCGKYMYGLKPCANEIVKH